ncbi:hypothetical protein A9798_12480 [Edwardsiella hoshinae]|uniref:Uncharacterized protein n=2 Tax=Edwardsiella hoshinae TaxID=93378 RepID=A0ABM6EL93_9GAMM|nr:hypothetical protein A9798_12480 [Edwardsiella hoshinae]
MKTTLKALALVTAAGVSGIANAATPTWVDGTTPFNKTFTASGTVLGKEFSQKWQWAVGPGLPNLQGALSQAQASNGNKVTIIIPQVTPILVGNTKEAFVVPAIFGQGGGGAIPHIAFKNGAKPTTLGDPEYTEGPAFINIDVNGADQTKIGTAKLSVTALAVEMVGKKDEQANLNMLYASNNANIFYGGLPSAEYISLNVMKSVATIEQFGGLSAEEMKTQVGARTFTPLSGRINENMCYEDGRIVSASYALGFLAGQTIEVSFDNGQKPTSTTEWTAKLGIVVTYN